MSTIDTSKIRVDSIVPYHVQQDNAQKRFEQAWAEVRFLDFLAASSIDCVGSWKGFLNESQFSRQYVAHDQAGRAAEKSKLLLIQQSRRACYAGWKIVAHCALKELVSSLKTAQVETSTVMRLNPDALIEFDELSSANILRCSEQNRAEVAGTIAYLPVNQRMKNLYEDETDGEGIIALEAAYKRLVETSVVYEWDGDFEPFPGDSRRKPFGFASFSFSREHLCGNHLPKLFHEVGSPSYWQRKKVEVTSQIQHLTSATLEAKYLANYKKLRAAQKMREELCASLVQLKSFHDQLGRFVEQHMRSPSGFDKLQRDERLVAMHNAVAARSMQISVKKYLDFMDIAVKMLAAIDPWLASARNFPLPWLESLTVELIQHSNTLTAYEGRGPRVMGLKQRVDTE
jgi:hypothetical protein